MIAGLILAAGESSRMGRDKALLPYRGRTFLETIIDTLRTAGIERITVVLGHHAEEIQKAVKLDAVQVVINPDYHLGQTSSLQAGLRAVAAVSPPPPSKSICDGEDAAATEDKLEAIVLCLVDHPAVSVATVRALIDSFRRSNDPVVIPTHQGQRGHPALISRALFHELLTLAPRAGANTVIREYRDSTRLMEMNDPGILLDVDDPVTYSRTEQ